MKWNISCHMVRQTMQLLSSQQLLKMSAFCPYKRSKMLMLPNNCIVSDTLVHAMPSVQQTLLQFVNAVQLRLMHSLLDVTPYLVIDRIKIGVIPQPQIWRNESGCWLLKKSHSVACPVCRGVLLVLLKDEDIAWHVAHHGPQLLRQEHVTVVAAVDLHSRVDKDEERETKLWDANGHHNGSIKRLINGVWQHLWLLTWPLYGELKWPAARHIVTRLVFEQLTLSLTTTLYTCL